MRCAGLLLLLPVLLGAQHKPPEDLRALVRDSLRFLDPKHNRTDDYAYSYVVDRKQLDSSGGIKQRDVVKGRKEFQEGVAVWRTIEKNGKPLTEAERRIKEENIRKHIAAMKAQRPEDQKKGGSRDGEAWLKEIPDALEYRFAGNEEIHGRPAIVLTCEPRQGYSAKSTKARVFEKTRGKLWIDEQDRELVKAEAETFDTVNVGLGIVGRIEKGTRFSLRRKVDETAWLLESQAIRFGARVLLFRWIGNEATTELSNWKRRP